MHLLILAYHFTSQNSVGNLRIQKLANSFQNLGYQVTLFAAVSPEPTLDSSFRVIQFPTSDYTFFIKRRPSSRSQESGNFWLKAILRLKNTFPFLYLLSPGGPQYRCAIQKAFKTLHADQPVTHLLTSYDPVYDLIIGRDIKRIAPELLWMVDFRDLPVDPVKKNTWWSNTTNAFYRKLLRSADRITTVSQGLARPLPIASKHATVLYNGFSEYAFNPAPNRKTIKFTITYTGTVDVRLQDPRLVLQALATLIDHGQLDARDIEFHLAGPQSPLWKKWFRDFPAIHYVDHGQVSHPEAIELQHNSQLNLLLTWASPESAGILTTKLFEYLAAQRPIIAYVQGTPDPEINQLVETVNGGLCLSTIDADKSNALARWIVKQYHLWKKHGFVPSHTNLNLLNHYRWDHIFQAWHDQ
ncbi:MAG: hypothetical protein KDC53_04405 [Saprospiraceae bacterium]|nr:hypothetical protein [Saprospiraceae bacterium]